MIQCKTNIYCLEAHIIETVFISGLDSIEQNVRHRQAFIRVNVRIVRQQKANQFQNRENELLNLIDLCVDR